MSLLNNMMGGMNPMNNMMGNGGMGGMNPMAMLQQMMNKNPQMMQMFNSVKKTKNPKQEVINKLKNGSITKEQFSQFKGMAKQFGVSDTQLEELEQYIK